MIHMHVAAVSPPCVCAGFSPEGMQGMLRSGLKSTVMEHVTRLKTSLAGAAGVRHNCMHECYCMNDWCAKLYGGLCTGGQLVLVRC